MRQISRFLLLAFAVMSGACAGENPAGPTSSTSVLPVPTAGAPVVATLDQSQTASEGYGAIQYFGEQAQTFTAGMSGNLSQVDVALSRVGFPGDLVVQIRTVSAGVPTTTIIASAMVAEASVIASETAFDWISVPIGPSVGVTSGTEYAIVLAAPGAPQCCSAFKWAVSWLNPYPGGTMAQLSGRNGSWAALPGVDFAFRTFVTPLGPISKDQCKNDSWKVWGFINQGQCVRFIETGQDGRA